MKTAQKIFIGFIIALSLAACGRVSTVTPATKTTSPTQSTLECDGRGIGKSFTADDGCNTCSCDSSGRMMCTLMACY